jgi:SOS-response transcriptional repressor LexA
MTERRAQILEYIRYSITERGKSPTMREIGEAFCISFNTAYQHVNDLIAEGALVRTPHVARGLALADDPRIVAATRLAALATVLARAGLAELAADAEEIRAVLTGKAGAA